MSKSRISSELPAAAGPPGRSGILFVLSAPSGAGKTSLARNMLATNVGLVQSVSNTTRAQRSGEQPGRDYHFVLPQDFQQRLAVNDFLEWAEVHGHLYGTSRQQITTATQAGVDVLLVIDVQGAATLRASGVEAVHIFIAPPSWAVLRERLQSRGTETTVLQEQRLSIARQELAHYTAYDYLVINDQLSVATAELNAIITAERHRVTRAGTAMLATLLQEREGLSPAP